jgi:integrase
VVRGCRLKLKLTTDEIRRLKREPPATVTDVYDTKQPGLVLRCRPNGRHTYRALLGRGRWHTLGALKDLELDEARTLTQGVRGDVSKAKALGQEDPVAARAVKRKALTFAAFVEHHYAPWAMEHKRSAIKTLESVETTLIPAFGTLKLPDITPFAVEQWRTRRRRDDKVSASTVNRNLDDLKSMLGKAAAWNLIATNPIASVKRQRIDRTGVVRFLEPAEAQRLLAALTARDERQRTAREQSNAWRRARGYQEWPPLGTYADHLHPFILLLLNTGVRRGEAFALRWQDVDLTRATVTIRGETAKSGQSRVIPLNTTIAEVLTAWRGQWPEATPADLVFASTVSGEALTTIKTGWTSVLKAAKVTGFRLHDCRHHFASQLVMRGVDLVTVSRLLGHSDVRMTMRYSHLAPDHLAAAVAKLVQV